MKKLMGVTIGDEFRIHGADCKDLKKDELRAGASWLFSDGSISIKQAIEKNILQLAADGMDGYSEEYYKILPCCKEVA